MMWAVGPLHMKKQELAQRIADNTGLSPAEAADGLDTVVTRILERLRRGKKVNMGRLGAFEPGSTPHFQFRPTGKGNQGDR